MRRQDFLGDAFKDLKFRVSFPGELVTTQEDVDNFAIEFAEWLLAKELGYVTFQIKDGILETYKKEKGL